MGNRYPGIFNQRYGSSGSGGGGGSITSVNGDSGPAVVLDTDDIAQGVTNLYYSDELVDDRVSSLLVEGTGIDLNYNDVLNNLTISSNLSTGIAGGQSVIGGTAASENLTISSTTHGTKGKILFGTSAYNESNNRLGIGTASTAYKVDVYGTSTSDGINTNIGLNFSQVTAPAATFSLALAAGGVLGVGAYNYRITYYTAVGETAASNAIAITTNAGNKSVNLSAIPVSSDPSVIGRKIYRSNVGEGSSYGFLVGTIADNTTTTFFDNTADSGAPAASRTIYDKVNTTNLLCSLNGTRAMNLNLPLVTLGFGAGQSITTAVGTTLMGGNAGKLITYGSGNSLFGYYAGQAITTGGQNSGIGQNILYTLTTGSYNCAMGPNVLQNITTGSFNIGIGYYTGGNLGTSASNNVFVGSYIATSGSWGTATNNTAIGHNATPLTVGGSNQLNVHNLIYGTGSGQTTKRVFVRGGSAQSGDIFGWEDSVGNVLASVSSLGHLGAGQSANNAARVQFAAGSTTIAVAGFTAGTLLTAPARHTLEYDGTLWDLTAGDSIRRVVATWLENTEVEPVQTGGPTLGKYYGVDPDVVLCKPDYWTETIIDVGGTATKVLTPHYIIP